MFLSVKLHFRAIASANSNEQSNLQGVQCIPMIKKKLLEPEQLSEWLTEETRKEPGCEKFLVLNVFKAAESSDWNWRIGAFVSNNTESEIVAKALIKVHRLAAARFNLM